MGCGGACSAAFAFACVRACAKARKGRKEEGRRGGTKLRWRIYERPKQAANPRPFACFSSSAFFFPFFFFPFFLFRIPTLARVVYLALSCRRRATSCRAVCTQKAQFHPVSPRALHSLPSSTCISYRRLSLFKFYIVSIVVVTSRRFDYAPRSIALPFLPQNLRLTAITCHSRRENRFLYTRNYMSL